MLKVKNWKRFQHYRDRNPPWIKLHFTLLTSSDWVALNDASRVLAIACMLIASRNDGQIDDSPLGLAYIRRVAFLNAKPNLTPLIECGFLESASTSASTLLANSVSEVHTELPTEKSKAQSAGNGKGNCEDLTPIVEQIPLNDGSEYAVHQSIVTEFDRLYPSVDVAQTLREIRGWCLTNPTKRKTINGVNRFIASWLSREQDKHG